jgi:hypothetical protein
MWLASRRLPTPALEHILKPILHTNSQRATIINLEIYTKIFLNGCNTMRIRMFVGVRPSHLKILFLELRASLYELLKMAWCLDLIWKCLCTYIVYLKSGYAAPKSQMPTDCRNIFNPSHFINFMKENGDSARSFTCDRQKYDHFGLWNFPASHQMIRYW